MRKLDPLITIFEKHLVSFEDSNIDRKTFVTNIVEEYLTILRKKNFSIPKGLTQSVHEELALQVETMLTKKIYGFYNIEEYKKAQIPSFKSRRRLR